MSYTQRYDKPIYIQIMSPTWSSVKLYKLKVTVSYEETYVNYETRTITEYESIISLLTQKATREKLNTNKRS